MDSIDNLQTDDSEVTDKDKYVINSIFQNNKKAKTYHTQQIILATLLFSLLSLPILDQFIETKLKITSIYYKLATKMAVFFTLYFLIINYVIKYKG